MSCSRRVENQKYLAKLVEFVDVLNELEKESPYALKEKSPLFKDILPLFKDILTYKKDGSDDCLLEEE